MKKILIILFCLLQLNSFGQGNRQLWWMLNNAKVYQPTDIDALKYVDSVALTDYVSNPIRIAIDTFVIKLKRKSFWTSFAFAYYPMAVQSANGNKWNLFNPSNTDAAFRLTFTGSPSFSDKGMLLNGTSQYARTHFVPSTNGFTTSSASFGFYSETQSISGTQIWGCFDAPSIFAQISITAANVSIGGLVTATYTAGTTTGLFTATRTSTTSLTAYLNKVSVATSSTSVSTLPAIELYLGARNNSGTAEFFSTHTCAFAFITKGMSATQQGDFYDIVQDFETRLNRNK